MSGVFFDKDICRLNALIKNCPVVDYGNYYLIRHMGVTTNLYPSILHQKDIDILNNIKSTLSPVRILVPLLDSLMHGFKVVRYQQKREARMDLQNLDFKRFNKGHKCNIQKSIKLGVQFQAIDYAPKNEIMEEFFNSIVFSRKTFNKKFIHSKESFVQRSKLLSLNKAVLGISQYESKKSYVYAIYNSEEGFYYDSGYNETAHPFTAHYCQYKIMEYLKSKGVRYYSLGIIEPKASYDVSQKNQSVDYYKSGFCKELTEYVSLE